MIIIFKFVHFIDIFDLFVCLFVFYDNHMIIKWFTHRSLIARSGYDDDEDDDEDADDYWHNGPWQHYDDDDDN